MPLFAIPLLVACGDRQQAAGANVEQAASTAGQRADHANDPAHGNVAAASPADRAYAEASGRMHRDMGAPTGDPDADFMRMMIPHHQGAVDMARVLLKYGHDEKLKRLAQSIIVEQGQEVAYMRTLLDAPQAKSLHTDRIADK